MDVDGVIAASTYVCIAARWRSGSGPQTTLLGNVVGAEHFGRFLEMCSSDNSTK